MNARQLTPTPSLPYRLSVLRMLSNARRVGDQTHVAQLTAELRAIDELGAQYAASQKPKGKRRAGL